MTEGQISLGSPSFLLIAASQAYPSKLQALLAARYADQTVTVDNAGRSGELTAAGAARFGDTLRLHKPQVVLLLEGVNDLNTFGSRGIGRALGNIEMMAKTCRNNGVALFVATLPPQRAGGMRAGSVSLVVPFNEGLTRLAADEGATLVDIFGNFDLALIGADGLHPTATGYDRFAEVFFASLCAKFEMPPSPTCQFDR